MMAMQSVAFWAGVEGGYVPPLGFRQSAQASLVGTFSIENDYKGKKEISEILKKIT